MHIFFMYDIYLYHILYIIEIPFYQHFYLRDKFHGMPFYTFEEIISFFSQKLENNIHMRISPRAN